MSKTYSAGIVTAYGAAKRAGYTGTYEDFCRQQAGYAESAATVEQAKNTAVSAANTATAKASEATTAATSAQTAKTQTEAAASQALTDIGTARSGAISAVQTEGQTQTANARSQAQAAATSATTASTKASEASASATSAGQSATNAAASATSAATSASAAQAVLESIPEDYSDLSEDVDKLKADLDELRTEISQTLELGALVSGNDSASTSAVRSKGFVYAPSGTKLRAYKYNNINFNVTVCQYDANKTFLTGQNLTINSTTSATTGSNTRYVRYFFWVVPAFVDAVTDENLIEFASLVTVTLPKGISENRIDIDTLSSDMLTVQNGITSLNSKTTEIYLPLINALSVVSDFNNINQNVSYRFNYANGSTNIPANSPYGSSWKSAQVSYFQSIVKTEGSHTAGDMQIFVGSDGVYIRYYAASWNNWVQVSNKSDVRNIITVDVGGNGDYTSLCAGIVAGLQVENTTVYVKCGTYDAITEMQALYGTDYFTNFTSAGENMIYLQNGIEIVCEPGTIMTCNFTGDNPYVNSYFAPINFRRGEASIDNLTIIAKNVRYCIHDDQWDSTIPYRHILKNCHLEIDNSNNTNWARRLAYGGGLGVHGYIEFDNCYFKSVGLDGTAYSGYGSCGFHNSPSADARNRIVVNNCYFADNSTFRFTYYGQATVKSTAFVAGCSLGRAMEITNEDASLSPNVNVEIIDCNNIIRN